MAERYLILGDGIAGATAAVTLRKHTDDPITILTDEGEPLYNRVAIKDFAKGNAAEEKVKIHDLAFYDKNNVELHLHTQARNIDDQNKVVITEDRRQFPYTKLLIATGGTPKRLPVPGNDAEGIHKFWTFVDARHLRADALANAGKPGIAIGAGLLGIDIAVVLGVNGVKCNYLMRGNRWWREGISKAGSEIVEKALAEKGVACVFHQTPVAFEHDAAGRVAGVRTESGELFPCSIAGVAVGLNMNTRILAGTRIKRGEGVLTDSFLQTSVPDVYAAGDIVQFYDVIAERIAMHGSWANAKKSGEVAALNMLGQNVEYRFVDTYSINHFDFMVGSVGNVLGESDIERKYSDTDYKR
ncbi:MAG TPA: FAD-dependent oxidoreductase, partial [Candidatus Thermoplasmatota archaeon]|nr:FAD-dependent oxidoreductase [Candidatus Thermoplasmatota archaeon]